MQTDELRQRAAAVDWWHTIDLGHGVVTDGGQTARALARLHMPERLDGKSVLDIGAWDGAYSFEAERRGAARVLSTEHAVSNQRGFELAREALGSSVERQTLNLHDMTPERIGTFDLVLCLGVLYHLRDPYGGLERIASVTKRMLILETAADMLDVHRPTAAFYPADELNGDRANWWGFNCAALVGILKAVGFREARVVYCPSRPRRFARAVRERWRGPARRDRAGFAKEPIGDGRSRGRVVVHAWR
jgi:tRNA (mo5U34)-methyltransferase